MIKDVRNTLLALGMPREKIHFEFFAAGGGAYRAKTASPPPLTTPRKGEGNAGGPSGDIPGTEAVAILDGIRHRFVVPPGGHVVDAALAAGIRVPYSCKGGMCCTCRAKLVEGKVEMTLNYSLEPWEIERGFVLTCQAVPKSERLVVDYDQM
jgi:ring-1,2-phenylacetyl-CoA epoxidase subunit PaaE